MVKITISTTVDSKLHALAQKFGIKWSSALRFGIMKLCNMSTDLELDAKVDKETVLCKAIKLQKANQCMQDCIRELNEQLEERKNVLEKKRRA